LRIVSTHLRSARWPLASATENERAIAIGSEELPNGRIRLADITPTEYAHRLHPGAAMTNHIWHRIGLGYVTDEPAKLLRDWLGLLKLGAVRTHLKAPAGGPAKDVADVFIRESRIVHGYAGQALVARAATAVQVDADDGLKRLLGLLALLGNF
jgi:hypothetical protein